MGQRVGVRVMSGVESESESNEYDRVKMRVSESEGNEWDRDWERA